MPPDPSRFTHFMPSPISSSGGGARSLDLPSPSMLSTGVPLSGSRGSASPGNYTSSSSYGQKRSYMEHDTASPEAGSSLDEPVKEEGDDSTLSAASGAAGENGAGGSGSSSGRALKNTKRAAQNRAAQQAFRKRKEERIKELEEKEKELQLLRSRSEDLRRKEQDLIEREQLFALRQIKAESMAAASASSSNGHTTNHVSPSTASSSHFPYATSTTLPHLQQQQQHAQSQGQANHHIAASLSQQQQQQQHSAEQDARLDDAHKMLLEAQADYNELKCQLDERDGLIAALRRSLEDLGAENRALRAAAGIQSPSLGGGGPAGVTSDIRTAES